MDESSLEEQLKPEEGIPWEDFFERIDQLQSSTVGSPKRITVVTTCVATLPFKKACCYGSCPTEETESLKIVRCKYCKLIVKVVGYGHHMRLRHGYKPPPSSASNSGDDCQDFLLSPPHIPMVASTSTANSYSAAVGEYDWGEAGVENELVGEEDVSRSFGSPATSRICSPPYYVEQCKDLVLVLSKRLPVNKANSAAKSGGKMAQNAAELKKLKKVNSTVPKKQRGRKKACTPELEDAFLASAMRTFDFEEEEEESNRLEEPPIHLDYMPQLSPSVSNESENSSTTTRPTTRQNSMRSTPNKKMVERKKKGVAGAKSKEILRPTQVATKKATGVGLDDGAHSISPSSTSSELSSNLPDAQHSHFIAKPKRQPGEVTPPQDGSKLSPGSDSESSIIAKLLKLPGVSVTTLSPSNKRSPLKHPSAPELLARVKQRLSSDVYDMEYRKRILNELDAKNILLRSPERSLRLASNKLSGQGRAHQTCSLPLSPSSESNYSSSSVSNDEVTGGSGALDGGLELHCLKPSLDTATARIRSFFLKKDNSNKEDGVQSELKAQTPSVSVPAADRPFDPIRTSNTGIVPFFMKRKGSLGTGSSKTLLPGQSSNRYAEEMAGSRTMTTGHAKPRLVPIYKTSIVNKPFLGATRFVSINSNNLHGESPSGASPSMLYSLQQQQQIQSSCMAGDTTADYSPASHCNGIGVSIAVNPSSSSHLPPNYHGTFTQVANRKNMAAQRKTMSSKLTRSPISLISPMIQQEPVYPSSTSPAPLEACRSNVFIDNQAKQTMQSSSTYVNGSMSVNENGIHRRLLPMQPNAVAFQQAGSSQQQQQNDYAEQRHQRIMMLRASQATAAAAYRHKFNEGDQMRENGMETRRSPSFIDQAMKHVGQSNKKRPHSHNTAPLNGLNMATLPPGQQALVKKFRPIVPKQTQQRNGNSLDPTQSAAADNIHHHPIYSYNPPQHGRPQPMRKVYTAVEGGPPAQAAGKVPHNYLHHHQEQATAHLSSGHLHYPNNPASQQQHQQQLYGAFGMNGGHMVGSLNTAEMLFLKSNNCATATAASGQKINGKMSHQQYRHAHTNYRPIAQKVVQQKREIPVQLHQPPQNMRYNNPESAPNNTPFSSSHDFSSSCAQFVINTNSGDKKSNHRFSASDISKVRMQAKVGGGGSSSNNKAKIPSTQQLMYIPSPKLQQQQSRSSSPLVVHRNNNDMLGANQFLNIEPPPILEAEGHLSMGIGSEPQH